MGEGGSKIGQKSVTIIGMVPDCRTYSRKGREIFTFPLIRAPEFDFLWVSFKMQSIQMMLKCFLKFSILVLFQFLLIQLIGDYKTVQVRQNDVDWPNEMGLSQKKLSF